MHEKLRPAVSRFACRIDRQMGDVTGDWRDRSTTDLVGEAKSHIVALERAHELLLSGVTSPEMYERVAAQAANAAAHLMMVADNVELGRKKAVLT